VDPVETQQSGSTFSNASSSSGTLPQFSGVTVGLGVLSSLLDSSAEDVWVTGTISTGPDGSESLEVVFTLKPVCYFLGVCGATESFWYVFWDADEKETPANRVTEKAVQETIFSYVSIPSHFLPATAKDFVSHCP